MRSDLETAIGVVLTSRIARDMITDEPDRFAAYFDLSPAEQAALAGMADDLAELMPGFVTKRERGLRQAARTTLSLLADRASELIEDYIEAYAPLESTAADGLRFADFLVTAIQDLADQLEYGQLIADVARFERLKLRVFGTEWPLWPEPEMAGLDPRQLDQSVPLWLHHSVAAEKFGWDVRTVRSGQTLPRLRPDPANLLCFQRPDGEVVVLRIDDETAAAVELIALRPGELSAAEISELVGTESSTGALLGKLITHGVIRGTKS